MLAEELVGWRCGERSKKVLVGVSFILNVQLMLISVWVNTAKTFFLLIVMKAAGKTMVLSLLGAIMDLLPSHLFEKKKEKIL